MKDRIFCLFIYLFWTRHVACGILIPGPSIETSPSALEAEVLITGPLGSLKIAFSNLSVLLLPLMMLFVFIILLSLH